MPADRMIPTEAEDLLAYVRQSIARASSESPPEGTPCFVQASGEPAASMTQWERLNQASAQLRTLVAEFGSVPPTPRTLRGGLGLSLVRFVNRLFWWPIEVSKRFAATTSDVARLQMEQHEQQRRLLIQIEKRLHVVETMLSRINETRQEGRP